MAAASVQREYQLAVDVLAEWVPLCQLLEFRYQLGVLAECHAGFDGLRAGVLHRLACLSSHATVVTWPADAWAVGMGRDGKALIEHWDGTA